MTSGVTSVRRWVNTLAMTRLLREALDIEDSTHQAPSGGCPGKRTMTAGLVPRAMVILRVESAEAARELGGMFGPRDGNGVASGADQAVARAAGSSGEPLRDDVRVRFETSLGADLSAVRVHTGGESAEASSAVGAKAYTVGNDIHFGAGRYVPDDPFGLHLLAHEVAHTQQQAGGAAHRQHKLEVSTPGDALEHEADRAADAMVNGQPAALGRGATVLARDPEPGASDIVNPWPEPAPEVAWDEEYAKHYKSKRPGAVQDDFDAARGSGKVKAASAHGGLKVKTQLSADQVQRIVAAGGEQEAAARCAGMAGSISGAFETMLIDTAQAQADYLAHMAGETGGVLEELHGEKRDYAPFQGRGPVQVTHPENYAKALGTLQQRADQILKKLEEAPDKIAALEDQLKQAADDAAKQKLTAQIDALKVEVEALRKQRAELMEAIDAIKADPTKAADPKYAFLLSAAHMHKTGGVASSSGLGASAPFAGNGAADSWVSGGNNGMTFDQRKVQNEGEVADIKEQLATETDPEARKKLEGGAKNRTRLIEDMKSGKKRGEKKAAVYSAGVSILSSENGVAGTP